MGTVTQNPVVQDREGTYSALIQGRSYRAFNDYAGRAHPEFSPDGGQTQYVTYVHDTGFLAQNLPLVKIVFGKAP